MATVWQKCRDGYPKKTDPACESPKCGHPWTVRYREPGGRTAKQREKSFPRKKEADAYASKVENDKNEGVYLDPKRGAITLRAWAEQWLGQIIVGESTRRNYEGFIEKWLVPNIGRKTLSGLTASDVQSLVNKMHRSGLAASTISDRLNPLRAMMRAAIREKRIADSPCEGVTLPRRGTSAVGEDEIPTLEQVHAIARNISGQYALSIWLMAGAGLRISEALGFSVDCDRGDFLRSRRQVSSKANQGDCRTRLVPLKHRTEDEYRDVPLPPFLSAEIEAHIDQWGVTDVEGFQVLFAPRERGKGTMPTATTYGYHWRKALEAAGLTVLVDGKVKPLFTPHSLRHFFASTALGGGVPLLEVSRWLGHRSIKVTADTYGHLTPDAPERFRTVMQDALRPALKAVAS